MRILTSWQADIWWSKVTEPRIHDSTLYGRKFQYCFGRTERR